MTEYYVCSVGVAQQYCNGILGKYVRYYTDGFRILYSGHFHVEDPNYCRNVILLENLSNDLQLILSLKDPEYKKVSINNDMSTGLVAGIAESWNKIS